MATVASTMHPIDFNIPLYNKCFPITSLFIINTAIEKSFSAVMLSTFFIVWKRTKT